MESYRKQRAPLIASYRDELQPNFLSAPSMARDGSRSSMSSATSLFSSGSGQNYALSPGSSYGTPRGSEISDMTPRGLSPQQTQSSTYPSSPNIDKQSSTESEEDLPLFDIEKDGDPRIEWRMYYDFTVTKQEACWMIKPGYLVTKKYPERIKAEPIKQKSSNSKKQVEKRHPCLVLDCKAKPFTRHYDLERHFRTLHGKESEREHLCDYQKCQHEDAFRKDHLREHYREFHMEDLVKRGTKQEGAESGEWWTRRNISRTSWRCTKCLQRTKNADGWKCMNTECNQLCEQDRQAVRNRLFRNVEQPHTSLSTAYSEPTGSSNVSFCGACENTWIYNETTGCWEECPICQSLPDLDTMDVQEELE